MKLSQYAAVLATVVVSVAQAGGIQGDTATPLDPVSVTGTAGSADSATQGTVLSAQFDHRPRLRAAELLEVVPGLIVTQHSGGGKANQYFLRGFNLDHGTDFATTVLGMPVNLPTHGHGQGYTDLNFVIPELVSSLRYRKGPYYAENGDFASAGSAQIDYFSVIERPFIEAGLGADSYGRVLGVGSFKTGGGDLLYALELARQDGPWEVPEDLRRLNAVLRYTRGNASVTAMAYDNRWTATDQIPLRAVRSGMLDRFGSLDASDGGESNRYSLSASWQRRNEETATQVHAYFVRSALDLFSNFTYFLDDPADGDQFEQVDVRNILGFSLDHTWHREWFGRHVHQRAGLQGRRDDIGEIGLHRSVRRQRLSTTRQDEVVQGSLGAHYSLDMEWLPWLRTVTGVRADFYEFDVDSDIAANSGVADDHLYSPKFALVLGPWAHTEFFLNAGRGFHSNDARGTTITFDPADPALTTPARHVDALVRSEGYEVGVKALWLEGLQTSLALWRLDLESELLFVGDAGNTEASRPSRREGIEFANYWTPTHGVIVDADLAVSRARFTDSGAAGDRIPGSIERTASVGVTAEAGNWSGGLRLRYFGPRPLIEDDSVRSSTSTLVSLRLGYRLSPRIQLAMDALNLFDREVSDIEYFYESQLAGEPAAVADVHLHPAEPRTLRLSLRGHF
jgi:hypothetical protein